MQIVDIQYNHTKCRQKNKSVKNAWCLFFALKIPHSSRTNPERIPKKSLYTSHPCTTPNSRIFFFSFSTNS